MPLPIKKPLAPLVTAIFVLPVLILAGARPAAALDPGFSVAFAFRPSLTSASVEPPNVFLDICRDAGCSTPISTITLICQAKVNFTTQLPELTSCLTHAADRPANPDEIYSLLKVPQTARLRYVSITSPPFALPGFAPNLWQKVYNYMVTPGPQGFAVQAQF